MSEKYYSASQAAKKWYVSEDDVAQACSEGIIDGAFKDKNGSWQIPKSAESPFPNYMLSKSEKKQENIIIAVISGILIVTLFATVGFNNIKLWLFSPFIWNDPDYIHISLIEKEESDTQMELTFQITNESLEHIGGYEFYITSGVNTYKLSTATASLAPFTTIEDKASFAKEGAAGKFFNSLKGRDIQDLKLGYHVKSLSVDGEEIFKANGWLKPVLLLAFSLISAFLGFCYIIKIKWLRMVFKLLGVPSLIILGIILAFIAFGGGSGSESAANNSENEAKRRASAEYKRLSTLKAGALAHGDTENAARVQGQMDKAMADMIGGSSSRAKNEYKRLSTLKAGALAHGDTENAARVQGQMDKAMADMIRENNKK